ncbi:methyltransferase domain-containing protein [Micromonospora sp. WMMD1120]|uniref:methyltransferase domain-containing protein n=1 Tax=Micromonospora sp. WMMD1120 TaxID=3016106 RepID=UPI002416CAC5|nr:methyltransferase domain-containing protein [Micromonospora sp. WMMD1120]MDG4808714.1 methyltransferase domain-containing protein [Micromonospora sp. WMMD1120]
MMVNEEIPPVGPFSPRFSRRGALRSEWIYGSGYQGPSSDEIFEALIARQPVWAGMDVLEIGSGLGGDAVRMATRYGVNIRAVDASADMTQLCLDRLAAEPVDGIRFETGDVCTMELAPESVDLVWTRDCLMYLSERDRERAWSRLLTALRSGGRVLVTDYCRGESPSSPAFEELHNSSGFHLVNQEAYATMMRRVGFCDVTAEDRTEDLLASEVEGRARLVNDRDGFLEQFTSGEYDQLLKRWDTKIDLSVSHQLTWMVLTARKP